MYLYIFIWIPAVPSTMLLVSVVSMENMSPKLTTMMYPDVPTGVQLDSANSPENVSVSVGL